MTSFAWAQKNLWALVWSDGLSGCEGSAWVDRLQDHTESPADPSGSQQPNKTLMRFKGEAVHFQPALFIPLLKAA